MVIKEPMSLSGNHRGGGNMESDNNEANLLILLGWKNVLTVDLISWTKVWRLVKI